MLSLPDELFHQLVMTHQNEHSPGGICMLSGVLTFAAVHLIALSLCRPELDVRELGIVRISVASSSGYGRAYSTGTHIGNGWILTCGHCSRPTPRGGTVEIRILSAVTWMPVRRVTGTLLHYDPESDVGLIRMELNHHLETFYQLAPRGFRVQPGDEVLAYDWQQLADGEKLNSISRQVTNVNRYNGPANIETTGTPQPGSSGGPLVLRSTGLIVGVTSGALVGEDRGLYAGLEAIYQALGRR